MSNIQYTKENYDEKNPAKTEGLVSVPTVLDYWDEIDSLKTKLVYNPDPGNFLDTDSQYFQQENNTLLKKNRPKQAGSHNSNARVEMLSVITSDIEQAMKHCLTESEIFALTAQYFMKDWELPETYKYQNDWSLHILVNYLNGITEIYH